MFEPRVSVVINTVNRARHLEKAISSLRFQRYGNFEVVVVNGPSTDSTPDLLRSHAGSIKVAHCPEMNLGMSRNVGIAHAAGDIVAFLDDDALPEPGWLAGLVEAYRDDAVGSVGGHILDHTGKDWQVRWTVCDRMGRARHPSAMPNDVTFASAGALEFPSPTGANASYRRRALLEVGGFDEAIAWFLDETEVALRVLDAGWRIALTPDAVVHHKYAPSHIRSPDRLPRNLYQPLFSIAYFSIRHGAPAYGIEAARARIAREVGRRLADIDFLRVSRVLDPRASARLKSEIVNGARDGAALAAAGGHGRRRPGELDLLGMPFLPFPTGASRDQLKIALVSQDYPPGKVGGIGIWTYNLARALAEAGHEVSVVCRGARATVDFEEGVWVHRIVPRRRPVGMLGDIPRPLADHANSVRDEIYAIAESRGLDVVSAPIWDLEGEAVRREGRIPVVTSLHTTYRMSIPSKPEWTRHPDYFDSHVKPIVEAEDRIVREAPALLANSAAIVADVFAGAGIAPDDSRVSLVPHGLEDRSLPRETVAGGPSILYVGRLEMRKGIDTLIDAIGSVLARNPTATLDIVGDETNDFPRPWREVVAEKAVADPAYKRVRFAGFVTAERLARYYADCDVFVAPSRYESFGLIYLEAMMNGRPCIGTTAGGIPEVVEHGKTGILVPAGDVAALSDAISSLVGDTPRSQAMGEAGRRRFLERFSKEEMARMAALAYGEFVSRQTGRGIAR